MNTPRKSVPFSVGHALRMANLAGAAYCDSAAVKSWSCGQHCDGVSGIENITFIEHTSSVLAAIVAYDTTQDVIIASFRGTVSSSCTDWVYDLSFTRTNPWSKYPKASVHHGFHNAWLDLKDDVMDAIQILRATRHTEQVHLTGHSLGAAICINAALDIKLNYGFDTSYLDFGRPRAGNLDFAHAVASEGIHGIRVTHSHDLVPHVPPEAFGFYHTSTEVYYEGSGPDVYSEFYSVCDGSGEDPTCSNSCAPFSCTSVEDHLNYMDITMGSGNCAPSFAVLI